MAALIRIRAEGDVAKAVAALKELGVSAKQVKSKTKEADNSFGGLATRLAKTTGLAVGGAAAFMALRTQFTDATTKAREFESALAEVSTLLGEQSVVAAFGQSIDGVRGELLEMAGGLGTAKELTQGLYQAISAGVDKGKSIAFVGEAAKLATAGVSDTATAVDILTTVLNAYGKEASEAGAVSDVLFKTIELGKCLSGDAEIQLADGSVSRIDALRGDVEVVSWDGQDFRAAKATWLDRGVKETLLLKLATGRELRVTPEHPLLTPDGWVKAEEVQRKSRVALAQEIPFFGDNGPCDEMAELIGAVLGDGTCLYSTPRITVKYPAYGNHIRKLAEKVGCRVGAVKGKDRTDSLNLCAAGSRSAHKRSPVREELERLEQWDKRSYEKDVPVEVYSWRRSAVSAFLRGLFDTDGWICTGRRSRGGVYAEVGYCSTSKPLARGVQTLLQRFGVIATLRAKKTTHRTAYVVHVHRAAEVGRFIQTIGTARNLKRIDWAMEAVSETFINPIRPGRTGSPDDLFWDRVIGIEQHEAEPVFDLVVPTVKNFLANGIVCHNTTLPELAGTLGRVIPIAASLGITLEEVAGAMATLTAGGLQTDIASTALRGAFTALIAQSQKFRDAGIEIIDVVKEEGMAGAFRALKEVTGGNLETMREFIPNVRGLTAVLALAGEQSENLAINLKKTASASGATEVAFEKMSGTAAFAAEEVAAEWDKAKINLGETANTVKTTLSPAMTHLAKTLDNTVKAFQFWADIFPWANKQIKDIAAPLGEYIDLVTGAGEANSEFAAPTSRIKELFKLFVEGSGKTAAQLSLMGINLNNFVERGQKMPELSDAFDNLREAAQAIPEPLDDTKEKLDEIKFQAGVFDQIAESVKRMNKDVEASAQQLDKMSKKLQALSGMMPKDLQQEAANLAAVFSDVTENFGSTDAAAELMGSELLALRDKAAKLGVELPTAFRDAVDAIDDARESAEGFGNAAEGAGNRAAGAARGAAAAARDAADAYKGLEGAQRFEQERRERSRKGEEPNKEFEDALKNLTPAEQDLARREGGGVSTRQGPSRKSFSFDAELISTLQQLRQNLQLQTPGALNLVAEQVQQVEQLRAAGNESAAQAIIQAISNQAQAIRAGAGITSNLGAANDLDAIVSALQRAATSIGTFVVQASQGRDLRDVTDRTERSRERGDAGRRAF